MHEPRYQVLFLCTGNSARSLFAECALQRWGAGRFQGHSAGSHPQPAPHPLTLATLTRLNYEVTGLRSKSWDEFAAPDAPSMDFVITVCDRARGESCPLWPGQPMQAHWGISDPAAATGSPEEQRRCFERAYFEMETRVKLFTGLPIHSLDQLALQRRLDDIGATSGPDGAP